MVPDFIKENKRLVEQELLSYLKYDDKLDYSVLTEAMQYSTMLGGKRIRPCLVIEFCKACGGDVKQALPFAAALEMIHTYSLIHDDLPCMDNDDLRRGKPSCHVKYGYANALLAGDALLTLAFGVAASNSFVSDSAVKEAVMCLSECAGTHGMVGGQVMDLKYENTEISSKTVMEINAKKTGALLVCAASLGCIAAGAEGNQIEAASKYAAYLGAAFQIVDDILDVTGDEATLGKPIGSDKECGKHTYVEIEGIEKAQITVHTLTEQAIECLSAFDNRENLISLANYLISRKN